MRSIKYKYIDTVELTLKKYCEDANWNGFVNEENAQGKCDEFMEDIQ